LWQVGGFPLVTSVSSTNKTAYHDIAEILLKVALNTINQSLYWYDKFVTAKVVFMARTNPLLDQQYHDARTDIKCFEVCNIIYSFKFMLSKKWTNEPLSQFYD
jgi:hypothetical protein